MPASLTADPLGIAAVFSDGTAAEFTLDGLPCPELARDLLAGLAELVHPHGTVDAAGTVEQYVKAIRGMARALGGRSFTGGAAQLRRPQLAEYWMASSARREAATRRMLQGFAAAGGVLDTAVIELAEGRAYNARPSQRPLPPYRQSEWTRLHDLCQSVTADAYRAHTAALAAAARGDDPGVAGLSAGNLCWLLAHTGPSTIKDVGGCLGVSLDAANRSDLLKAAWDLFPHLDVTVAYVVLFGVYSGIVPDGIADLGVTGVDWAGDATILLSYVKGRTGAESLNLPRRAVRLLGQWLDHSQLLRGFLPAGQAGQLWIALSRRGRTAITAGPVDRGVVRPWVKRHELLDSGGRPLKLHRSRIRTTHEAMRDKSIWRGSNRATIDPNHSAQVEGDHYLTAAAPAQRQAVESIIEDAQQDMLRRAHPPMVLTDQDAAAFARDYPQLAGSLDLDDEMIGELAGGQRDVFTAACADQLSGLHGPKGKPCPARPWVCLLCPLAIFAPGHAGNLLKLKGFFSRQWQAMPSAEFMAVFGPYAQRVGEVLDRFDPAVVAAAAGQVADCDAELPLRPEEVTR